ncbi:glycosyltransferase [Phocaeicola plebeius]|nr:glycosyltransferase [Phocaeicola plebeius]
MSILKKERIKVFHKENGGVSSARNLGIDNVQGEYFSFIDDY